eukprot:scaffold88979_cov39-Phaeocystis_antarctica.AAC.1
MVHLGGGGGGGGGGGSGGGLPPSAALWELRGEPPRGAARVGVGGLVTYSRAYTLRHVATDSYLCEERPGHPDGGLGVGRSAVDPAALFFLRPTAAATQRADGTAAAAGASVEAAEVMGTVEPRTAVLLVTATGRRVRCSFAARRGG